MNFNNMACLDKPNLDMERATKLYIYENFYLNHKYVLSKFLHYYHVFPLFCVVISRTFHKSANY